MKGHLILNQLLSELAAITADLRKRTSRDGSYRGYTLYWTGWKMSFQAPGGFGQWAAWPDNFRGGQVLYASYPGREGHVFEGGVMDCGLQVGQRPLLLGEIGTGESRLACKDALDRLCALIDEELDKEGQ